MIKAVIVDDELNARENLSFLLNNYCSQVKIIGSAESVSEAIELIQTAKPDLVFLDIEIGEGNGFDVLEAIKNTSTEVIFTTAFNQYAIKAFKFSAIDYLLKPIDIDELKEAVQRAEERIKENKLNNRLDFLLSNLADNKDKKLRRIGLPIQGGIQFFALDEIIRLQSQSNYTTFYLTQNRKFLISKTLKEYDEMLCDQGFVRVHQSHLVNIDHVVQYQKADGGYLILSDGSNIPLSKNYKDNFLIFLNKF
jgi:two-component system LytT family response regulator